MAFKDSAAGAPSEVNECLMYYLVYKTCERSQTAVQICVSLHIF